MIGEKSSHWRGGKCLRHGRFWQIIRNKVYERDKACQCCEAEKSPSGRNLDIHHIKARRYYEDQDEANIIDNLIALCAPCHSRLEMAITHKHVESLPIFLKDLALRQ